jgi:hypothetical protein
MVPEIEDTAVIALMPGASAHVTWQATPNHSVDSEDTGTAARLFATLRQVGDELTYLFFVPGDYQASVQIKYWTSPDMEPLCYASFTRSMQLRFDTPQFLILFGAALGGLIAFLIFPMRRTRSLRRDEINLPTGKLRHNWRTFTLVNKRGAAALGAMLWSAVVTILISRLTETQFLVSVSVADFWGAIAIGLVAQYAGSKWFERLFVQSAGNREAEEEERDLRPRLSPPADPDTGGEPIDVTGQLEPVRVPS